VNFPPFKGEKGSMGKYVAIVADIAEKAGYKAVICTVEPCCLPYGNLCLPRWMITNVPRLDMLLLFLVMAVALCTKQHGRFAVVNISQEFVFPLFLSRTLNIVHDTIQMDFPRNKRIQKLLKFNWNLIRHSRESICVSKTTATDLTRYDIRARVIYCFFDSESFSDYARAHAAEIPKRYDAVWCGTAAVHKNVGLFLELCARHPNRSFALVVSEANARTIFGGSIPANIDVFSSLDANKYRDVLLSSRMLISTSLKEGYGMPPMEAAMMGVPVLVTDIPVYREIYDEIAVFANNSVVSFDTHFLRILVGDFVRCSDPALLLKRQGKPEDLAMAIGRIFGGGSVCF
jgi:glycosyltransferase involved in cell wall biosynthesis